MSKFKVGDEVVVSERSRYAEQRKYGKAVVEHVYEVGSFWDVLVLYENRIGLNYNLYDLDKVIKFKGNK